MKGEHYVHIGVGALSALLLIALYFAIVGLLQGIDYAVSRFAELWYLMVPLAAGFGFQMGLFFCIRSATKMGSKSMAASGGMSTFSMVACCAHHVTDIIPVVGASALSLFFVNYQSAFLVVGIVSNVLGTLFILNIAKESKVDFRDRFFKWLVRHDLRSVFDVSLGVGIGIVLLAFMLPVSVQSLAIVSGGVKLSPLSKTQNSVTFDVTPLGYSPSENVRFSISMNTHVRPLDFDLANASKLVADGKEFRALGWEGSAPGGHHRSGTLMFPSIGNTPKDLKLVINNAAGADWVFEWTL